METDIFLDNLIQNNGEHNFTASASENLSNLDNFLKVNSDKELISLNVEILGNKTLNLPHSLE